MAFAVTKFQAVGLDFSDACRKTTKQYVIMKTTAAATDVAYDLGTDGGTFWTSALAHTTYGGIATQALALLKNIVAQGATLVDFIGTIPMNYVRAGSVGAGAFTLTTTNGRPEVAFNAANGPTSATIIICYDMPDGVSAVVADIG